MDDLSVPTSPLRVSIWLTDGRRLEGDIFLPSQSQVRAGPMLAAEWANLAPNFVPLRPADGNPFVLISRDHVAAFAIPSGMPAIPPEELIDMPVRRVVVETTGGPLFEGHVAVVMPPDHQRLKDWLNNADAYIVVTAGGRAHLIRKSSVIRVVELGED